MHQPKRVAGVSTALSVFQARFLSWQVLREQRKLAQATTIQSAVLWLSEWYPDGVYYTLLDFPPQMYYNLYGLIIPVDKSRLGGAFSFFNSAAKYTNIAFLPTAEITINIRDKCSYQCGVNQNNIYRVNQCFHFHIGIDFQKP